MFVLAKLLKALHSDAGPWSLSFGIVLGMLFGLTPLFTLHNLVVLFCVLFFRVNLSTFLLAWGLFSAIAFALDPIMMEWGETLLTAQNLQTFWSAIYNTGIGRLSQFNNTLVMGSLVLGIALLPVMLVISKVLIVKYRTYFLAWVESLYLIEILKGSRVYQIYQRMGG